MKVALCLSGHMRKFEVTFPLLVSNIYNINECDIYIQTWKQRGYENFSHTNCYNEKNILLEQDVELIKTYFTNIKKINIIEKKDITNINIVEQFNKKTRNGAHLYQIYMMYYMISESIKMTITEKYDLVVRLRPDISFNNIINLQNLFDLNSINVKYSHMGINDQLFSSNQNYMVEITKILDYILKLDNFMNFENSEQILQEFIKSLSLPIKNFNIEFGLYRPQEHYQI